MTDRRALLLVGAGWLVARVVFFEGLWGFDDLQHVRYALSFDHIPRNHWETRLLFNGLLAVGLRLFGSAEWVMALPGLLGSAAFTVATWWTGRGVLGVQGGLVAGGLAAVLPLDVAMSTNPSASSLANGFAAWGVAVAVVKTRANAAIASGLLFGLALITHPVGVFYVAFFSIAYAAGLGSKEGVGRAFLMLCVAMGAFFAVDMAIYQWLTGNPLHSFSVAASTHLYNQAFAEPRILPSGQLNLAWVASPVRNLAFSKAFGLILLAALLHGWAGRRSMHGPLRVLALSILPYWAWVSYGSQHPFKYLPLDHDTRYWYPLALAACVLAAGMVVEARGSRRWLLATLVGVPSVLLLSLSGPWGQNVEISRELLQYAKSHQETSFVTDRYTYEEMFVLNAGRAPVNVSVLGESSSPLTDSAPALLYNLLQGWRPGFESVRNLAAARRMEPVAVARYRLLAYLLPPGLRGRYPVLIRKPAALVGWDE